MWLLLYQWFWPSLRLELWLDFIFYLVYFQNNFYKTFKEILLYTVSQSRVSWLLQRVSIILHIILKSGVKNTDTTSVSLKPTAEMDQLKKILSGAFFLGVHKSWVKGKDRLHWHVLWTQSPWLHLQGYSWQWSFCVCCDMYADMYPPI